MSTFKDMLGRFIGMDVLEQDLERTKMERDSLAKSFAEVTVENERLKMRNDFLELDDGEKARLIMEDTIELENLYKERIKEYEELALKEKQLLHRKFAEGRRVAYAEMGIRAIEAKENGKELVATWTEDDLVQIMELDCEIDIDDLVEVTP